MSKDRITMSIDHALHEALEKYCKKEKRSKSNAVELAIEEFLNNHTEGSNQNVKS